MTHTEAVTGFAHRLLNIYKMIAYGLAFCSVVGIGALAYLAVGLWPVAYWVHLHPGQMPGYVIFNEPVAWTVGWWFILAPVTWAAKSTYDEVVKS